MIFLRMDKCVHVQVYTFRNQLSKLFRFLKGTANVECVKTSEGKIHVSLKEDKGSG